MSGNQFAELFAYLRRTGSQLVIPMLVFNEVTERYRDRLNKTVRDAQSAWSQLRKSSVSDIGPFRGPDVGREVNEMRKKLRRPADGVRSILYADVRNVKVQEIVRRGAKRIRPASVEGEELRDVILWLIVLQYAKQIGREVAFVTDDSGFRNGDSEVLHPQLLKDVASEGVQVRFYRHIGKFVADNALETQPLTEAWLLRFVSVAEISQMAGKELSRTRVALYGDIVGTDIDSVQFASGTSYRVGDNTFYVEAVYSGVGTIRVSQPPYQRPGPVPFVAFPSSPFGFPNLGTPFASTFADLLKTPLERTLFGLQAHAAKREPVEKTYSCEIELMVSARIEDEKRLSLQPDSFSVKNPVERG